MKERLFTPRKAEHNSFPLLLRTSSLSLLISFACAKRICKSYVGMRKSLRFDKYETNSREAKDVMFNILANPGKKKREGG